ncbi:MAG: putative toxin-antitoxin system toxin component, PIN family [Candidatus Methanomethylicia archaeon]|nr:putative toxin-antitoxin system toxin component, PIN family [Candidatus Methanomethylicia archaeon]
MKVVLETNVLVPALIKTRKPRELLLKIAEKRRKAQLILSRGILEEFLEVVNEEKVRRYVDEEDIVAFLRAVGSIAKIVRVRSKFKVVKEDPEDDVILRTAYDSNANYIVSGDKHLLSLGEFRGTKIVTVNDMLMIVKSG